MLDRILTIKNPKILEILDYVKLYIFEDSSLLDKLPTYNVNLDFATSEEYLLRCLPDKNKFDYPEYQYLVNLNEGYSDIDRKVQTLKHYLQASHKALVAYYPNNGYISWHHNGNASGYNILFTYCVDNLGCFRYYNGSIIDIVDAPGWTAKINYFPNSTLTDDVFWHCAKTINPRISIAFHIEHNQITDIEKLLQTSYE